MGPHQRKTSSSSSAPPPDRARRALNGSARGPQTLRARSGKVQDRPRSARGGGLAQNGPVGSILRIVLPLGLQRLCARAARVVAATPMHRAARQVTPPAGRHAGHRNTLSPSSLHLPLAHGTQRQRALLRNPRARATPARPHPPSSLPARNPPPRGPQYTRRGPGGAQGSVRSPPRPPLRRRRILLLRPESGTCTQRGHTPPGGGSALTGPAVNREQGLGPRRATYARGPRGAGPRQPMGREEQQKQHQGGRYTAMCAARPWLKVGPPRREAQKASMMPPPPPALACKHHPRRAPVVSAPGPMCTRRTHTGLATSTQLSAAGRKHAPATPSRRQAGSRAARLLGGGLDGLLRERRPPKGQLKELSPQRRHCRCLERLGRGLTRRPSSRRRP